MPVICIAAFKSSACDEQQFDYLWKHRHTIEAVICKRLKLSQQKFAMFERPRNGRMDISIFALLFRHLSSCPVSLPFSLHLAVLCAAGYSCLEQPASLAIRLVRASAWHVFGGDRGTLAVAIPLLRTLYAHFVHCAALWVVSSWQL